MNQNQTYQVLVVEDEPSLKEAIDLKLSRANLEPSAFDSGKQALEAIATRGKHFDGIWLDFDVKEINGLEFMQQFVTIPDWERCPVLIVSNTGNPELIQQAIQLGAKEWIIKAEVRLDDTVNRFIELIDAAKA
jgi:DNA-binding NtrC family response regulator